MSHLLRFSIALGCCLYYCLCFLFQHLLHNREWTRKQQIKPQSITTLSSLPSLPCDQTRENKPEYGTKSELHFFISPRRPLTFTLEVIHDFSIHCEHCNSQLMSSFLRVTLPNATSDMHMCARFWRHPWRVRKHNTLALLWLANSSRSQDIRR